MDSLWTDGKTAKRHLLHGEANISDNVATGDTSDVFTTLHTISSLAVVSAFPVPRSVHRLAFVHAAVLAMY